MVNPLVRNHAVLGPDTCGQFSHMWAFTGRCPVRAGSTHLLRIVANGLSEPSARLGWEPARLNEPEFRLSDSLRLCEFGPGSCDELVPSSGGGAPLEPLAGWLAHSELVRVGW